MSGTLYFVLSKNPSLNFSTSFVFIKKIKLKLYREVECMLAKKKRKKLEKPV